MFNFVYMVTIRRSSVYPNNLTRDQLIFKCLGQMPVETTVLNLAETKLHDMMTLKLLI